MEQKHERETNTGILPLVIDFVTTFFTTIVVLVAVAMVALRVMGWNLYSIDSYSMSPRFPLNALILVQPVEGEEISVGDVITYVVDEEGTLVTHRVTQVNTDSRTFTTKGDANEVEDSAPVLWGNVVGKAVLCIPVLGGALRVLTDEANRPLVIAAIVLLLAGSLGWDMLSARRRKRPTAEEAAADAPEAPTDPAGETPAPQIEATEDSV